MRMDIFEYIEMFHNVNRRYGSNNQQSSVEYEKRYKERLVRVYLNDDFCHQYKPGYGCDIF